jgi:hypothetical protein
MTIDELCADMDATINRRIANAVAAERERCAKIAEKMRDNLEIATAIRDPNFVDRKAAVSARK